ncbi:MAG: hypothetical protein ABI873_12635, partial [Marmoricola sp.]
MWKLIRYRGLQALTIGLLAAVITVCAVFAPLYDRVTQQALVDVQLAQVPIQVSGLSIASATSENPLVSKQDLLALVPVSVRQQFTPAVASTHGQVTVQPDVAGSPTSPSGTVLWRAGYCRHIVVLRGHCPAKEGEIAVSRADAQTFGYAPGTKV